MANANTVIGFYDLPAQTINSASATALLVPASGLYGTLPSPSLAAGAGLYISVPPDIATGSQAFDGHPFKVKLVGLVDVGVTGTFATTLYLGTSKTAASNSSISTTTSASITGSANNVNFYMDWTFLWDSSSLSLNGFSGAAQFNGATLVAAAATTQITSTTSPVNSSLLANLSFVPFFTFGGGANANNSVTVKEFTIERL